MLSHQLSLRDSRQTRRFEIFRMKAAKRFCRTIAGSGERVGASDNWICLVDGSLGNERKQVTSRGGVAPINCRDRDGACPVCRAH